MARYVERFWQPAEYSGADPEARTGMTLCRGSFLKNTDSEKACLHFQTDATG